MNGRASEQTNLNIVSGEQAVDLELAATYMIPYQDGSRQDMAAAVQ